MVPRWSERLNGYVLDFGGRVQVASVKNIKLSNMRGSVCLQFGKRSRNSFALDFGPSFSPVAAFSVGIASILARSRPLL